MSESILHEQFINSSKELKEQGKQLNRVETQVAVFGEKIDMLTTALDKYMDTLKQDCARRHGNCEIKQQEMEKRLLLLEKAPGDEARERSRAMINIVKSAIISGIIGIAVGALVAFLTK